MGSFVFPYALAQQAAGAMDDLAARLRSVVGTHDDALTGAHTNFSGETRDQFDRDLSSALDTLSTFARYLDSDAQALRSTIATARRLEAESQDDPP
jgi:uncharacterized protein YukE